MMADLHPTDPTPLAAEEACVNPHPSDLNPDAAQAILISTDPIHCDHIPTCEKAIPRDPIPTAAEEVCINPHPSNLTTNAEQAIPFEIFFRHAWEREKDDHFDVPWKIHRFPASLRGFCEEHHYIAPKMVAIGPYYHHLPELQEMEEVKKAAVFQFCRGACWEAYAKVVAVANVARSCYDAGSLEGVSDADFASMMFHDACFLLVTILAITKPEQCALPLVCRTGTNTPVVVTDMFLLENQIPWMVLEALMTFRKVDLCGFIATMGMNVQSRIDREARPLDLTAYEPPHLLGLFHFYQSGHAITFTNRDFNPLRGPREIMLSSEVAGDRDTTPEGPTPESPSLHMVRERARILESLPLGTSAIELAEIGIKLTLSKSAEFKDIGLTEGLLFRKLFLPSLRLNENTACWLVNMAAFETCVAFRDGDYTVSSYLVLFAMLMHREEDVHKLRAKRLIHGEFTNKQALDFFKGRHAGSIRPGYGFYAILRRLERYKQKRCLWIAFYKFVYNNAKTVATVLSIIGVLAGIFKALLDLKKQH